MRWIVIFLFFLSFLEADSDDFKEKIHIPKDFTFLHINKLQKQKIKVILQKQRKALKELHEKEEVLEDKLKLYFKNSEFDDELFLKENREIKIKMAEIEATFFKKLHAILTKFQRDNFVRYIEEWEIE